MGQISSCCGARQPEYTDRDPLLLKDLPSCQPSVATSCNASDGTLTPGALGSDRATASSRTAADIHGVKRQVGDVEKAGDMPMGAVISIKQDRYIDEEEECLEDRYIDEEEECLEVEIITKTDDQVVIMPLEKPGELYVVDVAEPVVLRRKTALSEDTLRRKAEEILAAAQDFNECDDDTPIAKGAAAEGGELAVKTAAEDTQQEAEVTVTFQPGPIGLEYEEHKVQRCALKSQARDAGVKIGWRLKAVNGEMCDSFEDAAFLDAYNGNEPYRVTFEKAGVSRNASFCSLPSIPEEEAKAKAENNKETVKEVSEPQQPKPQVSFVPQSTQEWDHGARPITKRTARTLKSLIAKDVIKRYERNALTMFSEEHGQSFCSNSDVTPVSVQLASLSTKDLSTYMKNKKVQP